MPRDGEQTDVRGEQGGGVEGGFHSVFIAPGPPCVGAALGLGWLQTAAGFPGSEQLSSFFNTQLHQHQAQVKVTSPV